MYTKAYISNGYFMFIISLFHNGKNTIKYRLETIELTQS